MTELMHVIEQYIHARELAGRYGNIYGDVDLAHSLWHELKQMSMELEQLRSQVRIMEDVE